SRDPSRTYGITRQPSTGDHQLPLSQPPSHAAAERGLFDEGFVMQDPVVSLPIMIHLLLCQTLSSPSSTHLHRPHSPSKSHLSTHGPPQLPDSGRPQPRRRRARTRPPSSASMLRPPSSAGDRRGRHPSSRSLFSRSEEFLSSSGVRHRHRISRSGIVFPDLIFRSSKRKKSSFPSDTPSKKTILRPTVFNQARLRSGLSASCNGASSPRNILCRGLVQKPHRSLHTSETQVPSPVKQNHDHYRSASVSHFQEASRASRLRLLRSPRVVHQEHHSGRYA
ncbi:hypothetical protein AKJ16_DCAP21251, partial [Drosera capensis]